MQCACAILSSVACPAVQHFSTLPHKRHDFRGKVTDHKMCVLIFFTTFVWNIFHPKKKWARYDRKCMLVFMWSTRYSNPNLINLEFSRQIFEKYSNIKFHEIPSSGSPVVPCGRTDRRDEANSRFFAILQTLLKRILFHVLRLSSAPKCRLHVGYLTIRNT